MPGIHILPQHGPFWFGALSMTSGVHRFIPVLLAVLISSDVIAQEVTGNIAGVVVDPSGAAIAHANVSVRETARALVLRALHTNESGFYSATLLPVGTYSVTVESPGFKRTTRSGIELNSSAKHTADFQLEVGELTQDITVEAQMQVELQTAQQSGLISGTQVRQLALNNRHFAQLVALQPGVTSNLSDQIYVGTTNPSGGNNIVGLAINGTRQSQNNWTVDGADNLDRGSNITILQYPSIDAIEEIRIVRSGYSAEFGRAGGGQISVITKSGTNELHGSVYEFLRNDKLNANNFFNNLNNLARPKLRYNNFGYNVGGPVYVPRLYNGRNKTFFFFSQEYRRVINHNTNTVQVPTLDERQGVFSNPVCIALSADLSTCTETGTRIANINPLAQDYIGNIFSKLPAPTDGNNLSMPLPGVFNARQEIVRIDHNVGPKLSISGRFLHDSIPTNEPGGLFTNNFSPGVATTETNSPGRSLVIRTITSFSPSFHNEVVWAWSRGGISSRPIGLAASANSPDIKPALVFPGNPERVPTISFTGGLASVSSFGPYENFSENHAISDNVTKVWRRHMLKLGAQLHIYRKSENQLADNAGAFTFANTPRPADNVTVQQSWAYFLLGHVSTFTQVSEDVTADLRSKTFEAYLQDDIKVRSDLTLNVGVRYSSFRQPTETADLLTNFIPALFDPTKAFQIDPANGNRIAGTGDPFNGVIQAGKDSPFGKKIARENSHSFAPRVGLAWDVLGNGRTSVRAGYGIFYDATLIGSFLTNIATNPTTSFTNLSISNTRFDNPGAGTPAVSLAPSNLRVWDPDYKDPYVQHWSLEIQREVLRDTTFSIGYVGTKGTHLIGVVDINQVAPGAAAAAGLVPAGGYITAGIRPRLNSLRPYRGYNAINAILSAFNSNYHALQTSFNMRFSGSGFFGFAYTWSKNLTDNSSDRSNAPQNMYDWHAEYGRATLDRRHVLTASSVYPLPSLSRSSSLVKHALGGWQISGIFTYNSGLPLTVTSSLGNDPGGLGSVNNIASAAGVRPDLTGDPELASDLRTIDKWFNTAAFAEVPLGEHRPGNAGRSILDAPGIIRLDFSLFKQFPIGERVSLQLRGEAFNVLNHVNFNAPNTALGNSNFGRILGSRDPRQIQVAAKLLF